MNASTSRRILIMATLIATSATAGSVYFSMGMGLPPCRLCWFQRIFMYPLVIVLSVAAWENRLEVYRTVLPLASLGWLIAAYHSYLQIAGTGGFCTSVCATVHFQLLGVLSIPNLALLAFTGVLGLMGGLALYNRHK